jgi:hypothetical protein
MIVALIGVAILGVAVVIAMAYFVGQRINRDREVADARTSLVEVVANHSKTGG